MYEPTCVLSNVSYYSIHYSCLLYLLWLYNSLCALLVTFQYDWLQQYLKLFLINDHNVFQENNVIYKNLHEKALDIFGPTIRTW